MEEPEPHDILYCSTHRRILSPTAAMTRLVRSTHITTPLLSIGLGAMVREGSDLTLHTKWH